MAIEGPRAARVDELAAVVDLSNAVFGQSRPHDMGRWFPTLFSKDNLAHLRVIVDDGRPVALAGFTLERIVVPGGTFAAALVGSVCTLASHQGRGFGTRLMEDCTAVALAEGATVLLISGGRGLYRRMGAIDAGRYLTVRVPRGAAPAPSLRGVRDWRIADVPRMAALYRAEPVRFERSEATFLAFLRTGRAVDRPCRTWVVPAAHEPSRAEAYLVAQLPTETPEGRVVSVQEVTGSREAALEALPSILDEMRADRADLDCLASDRALVDLAAARGYGSVPRGFQGTVKVIDPPGMLPLLNAFAGPGVTVSAMADAVSFRIGAEIFAVQGASAVTGFLFGSLERQPDLPTPGPLGAALATAFPVPLPDYGLNYI